MALGAMILVSAIIGFFAANKFMKNAAPDLPNKMALVLTLENGIAETTSQPTIMNPFPFDKPTIRSLINTLDRAATDSRVQSFVLDYRGGDISPTHIEELIPAINRFKAAGKKTVIYSPSYASGAGTGLGIYTLASAFDEIWMQPVGMVSIAGVNMEMPFGRALLDKIGVTPAFFKREEYKSAVENLTSNQMSPANREMLSSIATDLAQNFLTQIEANRQIPKAQMKALIDQGLFTDAEALSSKLIDRLDYSDILVDEIKTDQSVKLTSLAKYASATKPAVSPFSKPKKEPSSSNKNVALIYIVGTINDTASAQGQVDASKIAGAIKVASRDKSIDTIIVRVDSPGGSPTASETIARALIRAQESGKRVVISMGALAASGGYWISAPADKIYALPSTLTGSIGVVMGKFVIDDLSQKLGVNWDSVRVGENADILSPAKDFNASQQQRMNVMIDSTYQAFLNRVAQGRKMPIADVRDIAKGRAWTGDSAVKIGLVDALGGLDEVLNDVAVSKGFASKADLNIIVMPKPKTPIEQFFEAFSNQVFFQLKLGAFFEQNAAFFDKAGAVFGDLQTQSELPRYGVYDESLDLMR